MALQPLLSRAQHFRKLGNQFYSPQDARFRRLSDWKWFDPWRRSLSEGRSPVSDREAWITFGAQAFIRRIVGANSQVLEFGVGGSTLFFLDRQCRLTSVEHNREWFDDLTQLAPQSAMWNALLREPEPGAMSDRYRSQFPGYESHSFEKYVRVAEQFDPGTLDIVMVDGRARVDAGLTALDKIRPGGWLVLDNSERQRYAPLKDKLAALHWEERTFRGPGPYADYEFWQTSFWQKPANRTK